LKSFRITRKDNFLPLNSISTTPVLSKLYMTVKKKKETYGMTRHEFYHVIIPYVIVEQLGLQKGMFLFGIISTKTNTIRLHKTQHREATRIKIRQFLTKTYKNQRYLSTKVTMPIKFIKELKLKKGGNLDINYTTHSISIKKQDTNSS